MMQMAVYEVIHVIAMRHPLMTAIWSVNMAGFVRTAIVFRRAPVRIVSSSRDFVIVHMVAVHVVQVSIVQIVGVPIVLHRGMAAIGAVRMCMPFVFSTGGCHECLQSDDETECLSRQPFMV
jgi:hypothetical protein